jgi:dTDP-4-dehydrorhamnose 3,5-epimerase
LIPGVDLASLEVHSDERGRFVEMFRAGRYPETFRQANHSRSRKGVLRGLHYHRHQADLWYVIRGRARAALVDLRTRQDVPSVETLVLDGDDPAALYIPAGVAHGFTALTDLDLVYWVTQEYDPGDEHGIAWNDPMLNVPWEISDPVLSPRDTSNPPFRWDTIPSLS